MQQDRPASSLAPSSLLIAGSIALVYYLTGRFGLGIYIAEGTATLVWPPTGIAIAAVLLFGWRVWPGIMLGALLVNLSIGLPPLAAFCISIGNTLEALVAFGLLQRFAATQNPFDTVRGNALYVLLAALIATNISALTGAATTIAFDIKPASAFTDIWVLWWMGDVAGAMLLTPLLYLLGRRWLERDRPDRHVRWGMTGRLTEFTILVVAATVTSLAIHNAWLPERIAGSLSWLPFLLLLWSARRFSPLATVTVSFAVTLSTVLGVLDAGSLTDPELVNERLAYLYTFLFVQAIAALVTSAIVYERRLMIDDLRRTREQAQQASEQKSRFLANMSHEIRTPLNGIIGMTSLLQDESTDPAQRERLRIIQSSADSLLNILNDIIDHARIEAGKMSIEARPFPLQPLVRDVVGLFEPQAELKGIALHARLDGNLPNYVLADDTRLRQILVNVLSNAIKFTDHGSVNLYISRGPLPDDVVFTVTDTGIGIPAAALDHVTDPFTQADSSMTRRHGGSGLGLSICKQLIEHMGGLLTIRSDENHGTDVSFRLPLPTTAALPTPGVATASGRSSTAAKGRALRVLLAEDNPVNAMVTRQMLENLGCSVAMAGDGEQVLARAAEGFDLILMDCHMPRRDGYDACRAIRDRERATGEHVPVIALTANAMPEERDRCLGAGMDDYLSKPVRSVDLAYMLDRYAN